MKNRIALLALISVPATLMMGELADAGQRARPEGQMVYRPQCFASEIEYELSNAPQAVPVQSQARGRPHLSGKKRKVGVAKNASPPPPPAMPSPAFSEAPEPSPMADTMTREEGFGGVDGAAQNMPVFRPDTPSFDWGAKIFLSNDDSMSLASAQRVLWAAANNSRLSVSEIRPHELLNYFSFDTVTPAEGQVFDVLASAEQHGDQISLALSVQGSTPAHKPLDLTVLLDRSGSMRAEGRMEYTKRALTKMSEQLHDGDRLDIVLFDDSPCTVLENYVVGRDDANILRQSIASMRPRGGTNMNAGLQTAYSVAKNKKGTSGRNRRMMVITDANLNVGSINEDVVSEISKSFEESGIRMTGVGVGRNFNDKMLNKLTEKGKGAYVYLGSEAVVDRLFGVGFEGLTRTIAHNVHFELDLPDSLAMERFYGEEASTNKEDVQPIHYYSGTSQVFLQDLKMRSDKLHRNDPVKLTVFFEHPDTGKTDSRTFQTTLGRMVDADPHNVRKAQALIAWTDALTERAMGGSACGSAVGEYARKAALLTDDAEIGYVNGLVRNQCPEFRLPNLVSDGGVMFKVRVDSDQPISSVNLTCGDMQWSEDLSGSDTIASFLHASPGVCTVTLNGRMGMSARVEVPATGGDLRCLVRGGRLHCS